jgi:predicted metalloprotease
MRLKTLTAVTACALLVGACGDDSKDEPEQRAGNGAVVTDEGTRVPRTGGDPAASASPRGGASTLRALGRVQRATPGAIAPKIRGGNVALPQYLDTLANDVSEFWQSQYNRAGRRFPPTRMIVVTESATSRCTDKPVLPTNPFAFYCPADQTVFLPVTYIDRRYRILGDAPVGFVVAHEFAHRVQHVTGTLALRAQGKLFTRDTELQADCLSGVWASAVYARGALDAGDLDEFYNALASIGDPPGTPENHPQGHGTPEEREASFKRGYDAANTNVCALRPRA